MPTTHVEPDSESLLHDIASSLWKSRKVVVITGAGISTNSGIPDFRSENGLYSLINAQFEAAAPKGAPSSNGDADESDQSLEYLHERPSKRQKMSHEEVGSGLSRSRQDASSVNVRTNQSQEGAAEEIKMEGERDAASEEPLGEDVSGSPRGYKAGVKLPSEQEAQRDVVMQDIDGQEHAPGPPSQDQPEALHRASRTPIRHITPLPSPGLSPGRQISDDVEMDLTTLGRQPHFVSSPPSLPRRAHSDSEPTGPRTVSSSPLSSPPPILFDPYQVSPHQSSSPSPQSSGQGSISSRSTSEDPSSASTPLLTSQSSFASSSSRASLPNMKGKDLFDAQIWSCPVKTSVFYTFATTLRHKVRTAEPTNSHRFVSVLRDSRKLVRCYTQNIDQLEERVGLTTSLSLGAGSRYRFSARAGRASGAVRSSLKEAESSILSQGQPGSQQDETQTGSQASNTATPADDQPIGQPDVPAASHPDIPTASLSQPPSISVADTAATVPAAPPVAPASAGPNRGVECVFLHGSLAELRCFVCERTSPWDEESRLADTLAGRQPCCPHCAGATAARQERGKRALGVGKLRPDIVLYGEEHPHAHLISPIVQHDLSLGPDMLLILGTSMRVHGLKVLVKEFAKAVHDRGGKVVFVNFTKPPESVWADVIDYWVQWDCDAWVGDLQQRKPALWLPLGTALADEEKGKSAKASRKSGGGEMAKRKDGAKALAKRRESGGPPKKPRRENSGVSVEEVTEEIQVASDPQPDEMPPPPKPVARKPKPAKVRREPKRNADAKRPASIRDNKQNAAYCVWKILENLHRITKGERAPSAPTSPVAAKPKTKRSRKSAPGALETQATTMASDAKIVAPAPKEDVVAPGVSSASEEKVPQEIQPGPKVAPSSPAENPGKPIIEQVDSISAVVKSRKRKRTIWKMIGGVETQVSLDDEKEKEPSQLPHTQAFFKPAALPQIRPDVILPLPVPSPTILTPTIPGPATPRQAAMNHEREWRIEDGFRDTDRLIALLDNELVSCPATPIVLPPLQNHGAKTAVGPKLEPMEPQFASPGPSAEKSRISPNVGSPVAWRRPLNPFFFGDPLAMHFGYPPPWVNQGSVMREIPQQALGTVGAVGGVCGPEEQLRREQEAAMMLSAMRGGM
ncbi:hypothetical protein B0H67DRAFT_255712 [Lasiosphaeris hirsuta]|uniref:Deacetylase sirtuin-type domain-containing protein n=1 Tax=Lasiosphaeris hirsuta TaxID=260670 RepID=A0AA40AHN1_9PEZI|nr:hypothetical protein B0H67DRAFT_255712 [Lasiosphaeris hirsuta]